MKLLVIMLWLSTVVWLVAPHFFPRRISGEDDLPRRNRILKHSFLLLALSVIAWIAGEILVYSAKASGGSGMFGVNVVGAFLIVLGLLMYVAAGLLGLCGAVFALRSRSADTRRTFYSVLLNGAVLGRVLWIAYFW